MSTLYYGDNLVVMRDRDNFPNRSVDLIYLDPPFNSKRDYNMLYRESDDSESVAQVVAFEDYWRWGEAAEEAFDELTNPAQAAKLGVPPKLRSVVDSMQRFLGKNDMMAYLVMMAVRLVEMHRVLKPTGSLYLHCDAGASHYLKLVLDTIFGPPMFRNEIIWKRTNARNTEGTWPRIHDVLLYYRREEEPYFQSLRVKADKSKMPHTLITGPDGKKYQTYELTGSGITAEGESGRPWRGYDPKTLGAGRHWGNLHAVMDEWDAAGLIHWPKKSEKNDGWPRRRAAEPFDEDSRMIVVGDVWTDIDRLNQTAKERVGYPTQKPLALMERIITASSRPGEIVLDPFCGCGTTVHAAQRLGREWIGIDITHLAISVIEKRIREAFPTVVYTVQGMPEDVAGARELAERDKYQFQDWAVYRLGGRPEQTALGKSRTSKKGGDSGIDGRIDYRYMDGPKSTKNGNAVISVKGGRNVGPSMVRDLLGTVATERADIGVLFLVEEPTREMVKAAAKAGIVHTEHWGDHPKIQILTVQDLFDGKKVSHPGMNVTQQAGPQEKARKADTIELPLEDAAPPAVPKRGVRKVSATPEPVGKKGRQSGSG